jgi:endonuclease-8
MPEGPSIVILKELLLPFTGKEVIEVTGNVKTIDKDRLLHKKVIAFRTWGKHTLICFDDFTVKIHLLMFGTYRINETKDAEVRLGLTFKDGFVNFYTSSVQLLEGDINDHYDWSADIMNDDWDAKQALKKISEHPGVMICDSLMDQDIFGGLGNIIKNEVLYRVGIHPESRNGKIPPAKLNSLIKEVPIYSFQFLEWKKNNELKKHWKAHTKKTCERCKGPLTLKHTGVKKRRSFFCEHCQELYTN